MRVAIPNTTSMSCSTSRMVRRPPSASRRISASTRSRSPDPIPAVGSSSSSRRGPVASASAISSSLRSPCDSSAAGRVARSESPTSASIRRALSCTSGMRSRALSATSARPAFASSGTATFCSAVSCGKMFVTWKVRAIPARTRALGGSRVTSAPSSSTWPSSGTSLPVSKLIKVVFPAPLGPITAVMPPGGSERSTPATAVKSANALRTPRTSRSALTRRPCAPPRASAGRSSTDAARAAPRPRRAIRPGRRARPPGARARKRAASTR